MIDGFKVHITTEDLQKLLVDRAGHHDKRAATKAEEIPKLKASLEMIRAGTAGTSGNVASYASNAMVFGNDPLKDLESQVANHQRTARRLSFFAKHLAKNDTYALAFHDLTTLDLVG